MKEIILKWALKNTFDFGQANPKVVLGMILKENPEFKKQVPKVIKLIEEAIEEIKPLSKTQVEKKLRMMEPDLAEKKQEKKRIKGELRPLPEAEPGKVVVRIAPSPSGALHVGHAYGAALNASYADMYNGRFVLRIEDTNPENIYPPAYELIAEDAQWLAGKRKVEFVVQSSRLGMYYDYSEKLIDMEKAYVCTCDADKWRELKGKGKACSCRKLELKEQQLRYAKMFTSYAEGEAVLRLKTDIKDKNPAMRDFGLIRVNEHIHPKTGKEQRVWPLMVFSVAIDDHELGVTHVLNGKDHTDNARKEMMIMDCFGWEHPKYLHWGRINFLGFTLSASKTKLAIEQQEYRGWDDIRLPFLPALRKRGYQPEAFRRFAAEIGLSLNDKTVSKEEFWKMLNSFNKEIVEPQAGRFYFVRDPVKLKLKGMKKREIEVLVHPDFPEKGKRKFAVDDYFYVAKNDFEQLEERKLHRLMDCCNFESKGKQWVYISDDYDDFKKAENKGRIIHWLPVENNIDVSVLMEDGELIEGKGEEGILELKEGSIVQLERFAFCRLNSKGNDDEKGPINFWYLHK